MAFVRPAGSAPHPPWARLFGIPSPPTAEGRSENQELPRKKTMNLRNMNLDRREKLRRVPDKFAFIQLERDDGGSVLDVSEGGLRFETFTPVPQSGPVHLWFSLNLHERIEAWGEVVWTNATKKAGGLRFLRLTEEGRAKIREWISQPPRREPVQEKPSRWGNTKELFARIGASEPDAVARFVSKARPRQAKSEVYTIPRAWEATEANAPVRTPVPTFSGPGEAVDTSTLFPPPEQTGASGELVPMQRYLSAKRRQLILGLMLGTCISASVAVATIKYSNSRSERKGPEKAAVELSALKNSAPALPPAPMNPSPANSTPADIFGSSNSGKEATKSRATNIPVAETGGHSSPHTLETAATRASAGVLIQQAPRAIASRKKSTMTPQQLWASVQTGNTKSAVTLAELYIKGDGVPQNCNQARVLLLVASEKRNAGAIKRLEELDKTGCPTE